MMQHQHPQVHHYHHICYRPSRMRFVILGIVILSPICALLGDFNKTAAVSRLTDILSVILRPIFALLEFFNNIFHGTLKLVNAIFCSYMHLLDLVVRFCGGSGGLRTFWNAHPSWSTAMFFGLPIFTIIVLLFLLKREFLALPIIFLFYIWHHGLSTMIHTHSQWILLLSIIGLMLAWSLGNQVMRVFKKTPKSHKNDLNKKSLTFAQ